jgi:hypothetical protein
MSEPSTIASSEPRPSAVAKPLAVDSRLIVPRAIFRGTAIGAGGALVLSTVIGVAAVIGMVNEGLSPQTIARQMNAQWDIRLFVALAELLTAMLAGYTAAVVAGRTPYRHSLWAGGGTLAINLLVIAVCGNPLPVWLAASSLALVLPCAMLGGYLAAPARERPVKV